MSALLPVSRPSQRTPVETAELLRAHLMGCAPARAVRPEAHVVPAGLVDIRKAAPRIVVLEAPSWSEPELRFLVRPEVAERLQHAIEVLPSDIRLGFWEGLRPIHVQWSLWRRGLRFLRASYPHFGRPELELALELYVARPDGVTPPHSTGSAVDIAPVDAFGRVLGPADAWGRLAMEVIARVLRDTGLANYEPEWWHWSYGDEEWARAYDCQPAAVSAPREFDGPGGGI